MSSFGFLMYVKVYERPGIYSPMSSQNQQKSADPTRMRTLFLSRLLRAVRLRYVTEIN